MLKASLGKARFHTLLLVIVAAVAITAGAVYFRHRGAQAGPHGGDLVLLEGGHAYAEVLANAESGEAVVHTWDPGLTRSRPLPVDSLVLGSGEESVVLLPEPMDDDPAGMCSRFHGRAGWLRGGSIHHGWLQPGDGGRHHPFAWGHCWDAGRAHGSTWHGAMGHGHGFGHHGEDHED